MCSPYVYYIHFLLMCLQECACVTSSMPFPFTTLLRPSMRYKLIAFLHAYHRPKKNNTKDGSLSEQGIFVISQISIPIKTSYGLSKIYLSTFPKYVI